MHAQAEAAPHRGGALSSHWQAQTIEQRQEEASRQRAKFDEAISALRAKIEQCGGFEAIGDAYAAEIAAEEDRRRRHRDIHASLARLPRLFSAV